MNIHAYLEIHFEEIKRKVIAVTRNHQNTDDLLNDCILSLLERGSDFTQQLVVNDKVQHYLVRACYIQYNSSTSSFYETYKKGIGKELTEEIELEDKVEEHEDVEKLAKEVKLYIGNLPVYERTLAQKHYLEGTSQREMSNMYNINRIHIAKDINNIKKNIKISFNRNQYRTK